MTWLANLLDRFLNWLVPTPDFSHLIDEEFFAPADSPLSEVDPLHVGGVPAGSPDPLAAGDGASAAVPGGFTDDEIIAGLRSYLRKFYRG